MTKLFKELSTIVTVSEKKIIERSSGIYSLRALLKAAIFYPDTKSEIIKQKLITKALGEDGYLHSHETLGRLSLDDMTILADLIILVLQNYIDQIDLSDTSIFETLATIISSKSWKARLLIQKEIEEVKKNTQLHKPLFEGLCSFIDKAKVYDLILFLIL